MDGDDGKLSVLPLTDDDDRERRIYGRGGGFCDSVGEVATGVDGVSVRSS